jgi:hypothetical protein
MSGPHFVVLFKPSLKYFLLGTVLFFVLFGLLTVAMGVRAHFYPPRKDELPYDRWTPDPVGNTGAGNFDNHKPR